MYVFLCTHLGSRDTFIDDLNRKYWEL